MRPLKGSRAVYESSFEPRATSRVGARGLMQIMPKTASFIENDASYEEQGMARLLDAERQVKAPGGLGAPAVDEELFAICRQAARLR